MYGQVENGYQFVMTVLKLLYFDLFPMKYVSNYTNDGVAYICITIKHLI